MGDEGRVCCVYWDGDGDGRGGSWLVAMDRTSLLYDTLAATQPYFDTTETSTSGSGSGVGVGVGVSVTFSRLRVLEEVKRRSSRLFSLPFHCRARDLSATIRHLSDTF